MNRIVVAGVMLVAMQSVHAQTFNDAYRAYQQALESGEPAQIQQTAQTAYELGLAKFEPLSDNRLALGLNYLSSMVDPQQNKAALAFGSSLLEQYQQRYGEQAVELIDLYFVLAKVANFTDSGKDKGLRYQRQITTISADQFGGDSVKHGEILSQVLAEFRVTDRSRLSEAKNNLTQLDKIIAKHNLQGTNLALSTQFYWGKHWQTANNKQKSIKHFEAVIEMTEHLTESHPLALSAHAFLVPLYERTGRSELATAHCQAIGAMTPWTDSVEQTPLYRSEPDYPISAARQRKEGWVVVQFDVDTDGFVRNITTLNNDGADSFIKSTHEAVANWRYAPKFVDGKAVVASSRVRLDYTISKR